MHQGVRLGGFAGLVDRARGETISGGSSWVSGACLRDMTLPNHYRGVVLAPSARGHGQAGGGNGGLSTSATSHAARSACEQSNSMIRVGMEALLSSNQSCLSSRLGFQFGNDRKPPGRAARNPPLVAGRAAE